MMAASKRKANRQTKRTQADRQGQGFAPSNSTRPLVSICTVTFNRSPFLPLLERCILAQTYPRELLEWVLVDDSDDGRPHYEPTPGTGLRTRIERLTQRLPLGPKRNLSHSLCSGDIIVYMDDDDYYPPERVSHAVDALTKSECLIAGSSVMPIMFLPEREVWIAGPYGPNHATAGTFAFKKELLKITQYQEHARIAEEKAFLRNYTIPLVQLDPLKTIVCMAHSVNTFDKRNLIQGGKNPRLKQGHLDLRSPSSLAIIEQYEAVTLAESSRPAPLQTLAKPRLDIVIPSRNRPHQSSFLSGALESIAEQTICSQFDIRAIVAIEPGSQLGNLPQTNFAIHIVEPSISSQAAALNRALQEVEADFVAFLEDDDQWHPCYLELAHKALTQPLPEGDMPGFVSSTQMEENTQKLVIRVNDLASPSGWLMYKNTLITVGNFNEEYHWHPDIDWLGRLGQHAIPRIHMVEGTAPFDPNLARQIRPLLGQVLNHSNNRVRLLRHKEWIPLVGRLCHDNSRTAITYSDPNAKAQSQQEVSRLIGNYGYIPR